MKKEELGEVGGPVTPMGHARSGDQRLAPGQLLAEALAGGILGLGALCRHFYLVLVLAVGPRLSLARVVAPSTTIIPSPPRDLGISKHPAA